MTTFAHTYESVADCASKFVPSSDAAFTLVYYRADGKVQTVDSNEVSAYANELSAEFAAMFAINNRDDSCDVYNYGEYHGTAEYVDMAPEGSFFSRMELVFSKPC